MTGRIYNINEAPARGHLRIGVDEAGYGPRLGPLVVAASAFLCDTPDLDLYAVYAGRVGKAGSGAKVIVDDSKRIFRSGRGLDGLRRGVESFGEARLRCRVIDVPEFNALVENEGNKANVLSRASLSLARDALDGAQVRGATLTFDRHGGRRRYGDLLAECFDGVEIVEEGRDASRYRVRRGKLSLAIAFVTKGDSRFLEVALASMRAKLERELAMGEFNRYWCSRYPGLQPTQGYPTDARRFTDELRRRGCDLEDLRAMQRSR